MDGIPQALVMVIGEGKTEEGEGFLRPGSPGDPIHEGSMGVLHLLVKRVLRERAGVEAIVIWPPMIRSGRRGGNPGLLHDIAGRPRRADATDPPRVKGDRPEAKPWLSACSGRLRADLVVIIKDACRPGMAEETRSLVRRELSGATAGVEVIVGAATPGIEGWLLPIDEAENLDEKQAKERWNAETGRGSVSAKIERSREIVLDEIERCSPTGFAPLCRELERWAVAFRDRH